MPDLGNAYTLASNADVKTLYAEWAGTYDTGFAETRGYQLHALVAAAYVQSGGTGPVLDVGAGTGLVGERLAQSEIADVDGMDLSQHMLDIAQAKGVYSRLFTGDVTKRLPVVDGTYRGVVSAGTFTLGHVGPSALGELIRILAPGGMAVISVNVAHWREAGFEDVMKQIAPLLSEVILEEVPIYRDGATHDHAQDTAYLLRFRCA